MPSGSFSGVFSDDEKECEEQAGGVPPALGTATNDERAPLAQEVEAQDPEKSPSLSSRGSRGCGPSMKQAASAKKKDSHAVYLMLDEDEQHLAMVKLKTVEGFGDSLTSLQLGAGGIRTTWFVFIIDQRRDVCGEAMPILSQAFAEIQFMVNSMRPKVSPGKLRVLLLTHQVSSPVQKMCWTSTTSSTGNRSEGSSHSGGDSPRNTHGTNGPSPTQHHSSAESQHTDGFSGVHPGEPKGRKSVMDAFPEEAKLFIDRLDKFAKCKNHHRSADLDNGDSLVTCIQRLARETYRGDQGVLGNFAHSLTTGLGVTRTWSSEKTAMSRCCVMQ
jgi:hypothetical protein